MKPRQGKDFEKEAGDALAVLSKLMNLEYRNSNTPSPICDHIVFANGRAYLLEEKETRDTDFSFRRITTEERKGFESFHRAGCEGWILIKFVGINFSTVYACTWADWLELEDGYGFSPLAKRNKPGSGSFPLLPDEVRPGVFIELQRVKRKDFQGGSLGNNWDLSPLFNELLPEPIPPEPVPASTYCPKCYSDKIRKCGRGHFHCQLCSNKWTP